MTISSQQYAEMLARTERSRLRSSAPSDRALVSRESDLHDQVIEHCHAKGWLCIHSRMDRPTTTGLGVSDCIIVTPRSAYFIELKRKGGKPTPAQLAFLAQVRKLGWPCGIAYCMGDVLEILKGGNK